MQEEINKEFVKFFDNETYQNYQIYTSQNQCLSKKYKASGTQQVESKEHKFENSAQFYKIIKTPFERN